jgi:hypothetical protein
MTSKRLYFVLLGLLCLVVISVAGGSYAINAALEKQSNKLVSLKAKQQSLQQEQTQLTQMKKDILDYNNLYKISQLIVPESKDQTETVRQIVNLAKQSGVTLQSITFPASSLGTGTSPLALNTEQSATPGTAATPIAGTTVIANPALSQLVPIAHIPGVYDLQVEVASATDPAYQSTYPQVIHFLSALEQNRLTAQVSQIDLQPNSQNSNVLSFTLNLDIFIKPGSTH